MQKKAVIWILTACTDTILQQVPKFSTCYHIIRILSDVNIIRYRKSYHWIFSDVNIIRGRITDTLMLISSDAEKQLSIEVCLMFIWSDAEKQIWLNSSLSDVNIIRCRENRNYWTMSDVCNIVCAVKRGYHGILSDVNIISSFFLMLKTEKDIIEFCLRFSDVCWISSDAEKRQLSLNFVWC